MIFPFESLHAASRELGLVVAVLIGIGFGFVLERAGFGRANKLAAQFYLRDMTVFKVMFTAIVTAMLGLVGAAGLGLVDLGAVSESIVSWSYVWPMLAGGFALGVGFIVSGYCPGTSLVSSASGNVDGMAAFAGVVTGTLLYSEALRIDVVQRFHDSGEKGGWFLYDLFHVSPQLLAVVIAIAAVGAFVGAEKVERLVTGRDLPRRPVWRFAAPAFGTLATIALISAVIPHPTSAAPAAGAAAIGADDLAKAVVAEPWRYRIEGAVATDVTTGRTLAISGEYRPLVQAAAQATVPATQGGVPRVIAKPKKKGGGCSS
jgi:hypothetical protein